MRLADYLYEIINPLVKEKINTKELRTTVIETTTKELLKIFSINEVLESYHDNKFSLYNYFYKSVLVKCDEENNDFFTIDSCKLRLDVCPKSILMCEIDSISKKLELKKYDVGIQLVF